MNTGESFQTDPDDELAKRIAYLINGYNLRNLSQEEDRELDDWVTASMRNQQIFEELTDPANLKKWMSVMEKLDRNAAMEKIKSRIRFEPKPHVSFRWNSWPYWTAAAVLIGIIFLGAYWFEKKGTNHSSVIALNQDLPPGGSHATLILGDGKTILLDSLKKGRIENSSGLEVMKDSSGLQYEMSEKKNAKTLFDMIKTPAGGQFQVVLSDGTRVWLNASSSLKYPEFFSDSLRKVVLTGEGYFEVTKNASHPFIVNAGNNEVRVLGTHFNVNAYADNSETVVTLAEGSIKLNGSALLRPGQQGFIDQAGKIRTGPADLETALAWKNGQFIFKMTPLPDLMKQVSHWYDAKIVYRDTITEHFNARIPRDVPVSRLLHLLEATGQVHFKIE
ncbi:MAG TPA: FecR domain-containing protein, partial [Puia sp.]|nr:FecR domain-containing protein [Puia sp.]